MAFSDLLTDQQKADCLLARGMDFDTYIQRMLDTNAADAKSIRLRDSLTKLSVLPDKTQTDIVATIDTEFAKVTP